MRAIVGAEWPRDHAGRTVEHDAERKLELTSMPEKTST
jgi:hypothetical protein